MSIILKYMLMHTFLQQCIHLQSFVNSCFILQQCIHFFIFFSNASTVAEEIPYKHSYLWFIMGNWNKVDFIGFLIYKLSFCSQNEVPIYFSKRMSEILILIIKRLLLLFITVLNVFDGLLKRCNRYLSHDAKFIFIIHPK